LNSSIFRVCHAKFNFGRATFRLIDIFLPAIEREHIETEIAQKDRKMAEPATDVHSILQLKVLPQGFEQLTESGFSRGVQRVIVRLVKDEIAAHL